MHLKLLAFLSALLLCIAARAQVMTREDSLAAGLVASNHQTVLSGYGEVVYTQNITSQAATASLRRAVLFVGHRFSSKTSLFTELEIENALVAGDENLKGEVGMEQAFLKFDLSPSTYINAGLFIPRIGIIVSFGEFEKPTPSGVGFSELLYKHTNFFGCYDCMS